MDVFTLWKSGQRCHLMGSTFDCYLIHTTSILFVVNLNLSPLLESYEGQTTEVLSEVTLVIQKLTWLLHPRAPPIDLLWQTKGKYLKTLGSVTYVYRGLLI